MRKIKKINGYLIVKFNDREKCEHEGTALGEYGVIDAELYTGHLDIDRGVMEYDDADSLEVAVELARGLESEEDITDEPPTYKVITETDETFTEEEVNPQLMIEGWETQLKTQIKSKHHPDVDPITAAHELYGFKVALNRVGFLPDCETYVDPDHFAPTVGQAPLPRGPEDMLTHICDNICKERIPGRTQDELDAICEKCAVDRLYQEAESRELRAREKALGELNSLLIQLDDRDALPATVRRLEFGARQYLKALQTVGFLTEREIAAFDVQIEDTLKKHEHISATPKACPGNRVWILERDEYGESAADITGYIFLAHVGNAVVVTPVINGCKDIKHILEYHIETTRLEDEASLCVYPASDCFLAKVEAEAARRAEGNKQ